MLRIAPAVAVAALIVPAAASSAPAVTLDRSCYAHLPTRGSEPIVATITGGTPGAGFLLAATDPGKGTGSAGSVSGTFDGAGNATAQIPDVSPPSGTINPSKGEQVQLSVQDFGAGGAETPVGTALITNIAITVSSRPRSPRAHRLLRVSAGSTFAGKALYGFVVKPGASKVLRRFRVGKANACGYASTRAIVAPRSFRAGSYRVYVNAGRRLNKPRAVAYAFTITHTF
jgi:hypothetical protein